MRLTDFVRAYAQQRDLRPATMKQLIYAAESLDRYAAGIRPAGVRGERTRASVVSGIARGANRNHTGANGARHLHTGELSVDLLDGWIAARLDAGIARKTASNQRRAILSLWREAHRRGIAPLLGEVRRVRVATPIPEAWRQDEIRKLLRAARSIRGRFRCGVPRRLLLVALILTGYYTGLRPSDLLALRVADVVRVNGSAGANGSRRIVRQSKTGELIDLPLPADCLRAIQATRPESRDLLFPLTREVLCDWFRRVCRAAGVRGTPKWLRRTGATHCEIQQPGSAMRYLGHRTPGLAYKHYVDPRQVGADKPVPPSLEENRNER